MTLGFSTTWPDGKTPTLFKEKILLPYDPAICLQYPDMMPKIHTFRLGHRWRDGMRMHMVTGNRTPQRQQFNYFPGLGHCSLVQQARIFQFNDGGILIGVRYSASEDFRALSENQMLLFAANDGFNSLDEMTRWFFPKPPVGQKVLEGQIIHWTNFCY